MKRSMIFLMPFLGLAIIFISCAKPDKQSAERTTADIKSLIRKGIEGFNNRTPEITEQTFSSKFIYQEGSNSESSEVTIRSFYDDNLATFPDFKFTIEDIIVEGNKVALRLIFEGTHKTIGKKVRMVDHWIGKVENGKFVEVWEVTDDISRLKQLGYTITPPQKIEEKK